MLIEFLFDYGIFFAKGLTIAVLVTMAVITVFFIASRRHPGTDGQLEVRNLNQKYEQMQLILNSMILPKKAYKKSIKDLKARHKQGQKKPDTKDALPRIFVLNFKGDLRASEVASLREEVTAVLSVAEPDDEVLVKIESGGGTVHGYGLAASQLRRIREKGIKLTVAVDKVAASGGYMMACVANTIIAAPFAIIGSIGVLAQIPNFHRLLKKHNIDFEQISAGKFKRSLTLFGENSDEDREKLRQELEETHDLFKQFVIENRAQVDIEMISTGEHWYGKRALDLKLVDELKTSDDFLTEAVNRASLYELTYTRKKPIVERLFSSTAKLFSPEEY
jgi:serine protease SohB